MTTERETRELLTELLRNFYARNWVSGTGGGICGPADGGGLLLAPTGVHKERVGVGDFFTVDPANGSVLAGDMATDAGADHLAIRDLEMLKGIRGVGNRDVHLLPVIRNTPRESELVDQIQRVLDDPRFRDAFAIVVADHGAYIWGDDVMEAKRHTEVYHFLFEATVARHDRQNRQQNREKEGHA